MLAEFDDADNHCATGLLHAALGDGDSALVALARIREWSYWATPSIHHCYSGVLGPMRRDPRYRPTLERAHRAWGLEPDGAFPDAWAGHGSSGGNADHRPIES